jgi:hypothetical protein
MKFFLVVFLLSSFSFISYAETIKVKSYCLHTGNTFIVQLPIQLTYKNKATTKILSLDCHDDNSCIGVLIDAETPREGLGLLDITLMKGVVRTINKPDLNVVEWGFNKIIIDFKNKKIMWRNIGRYEGSQGIGEAVCQ